MSAGTFFISVSPQTSKELPHTAASPFPQQLQKGKEYITAGETREKVYSNFFLWSRVFQESVSGECFSGEPFSREEKYLRSCLVLLLLFSPFRTLFRKKTNMPFKQKSRGKAVLPSAF
jgi:hypothetical protein